MLRRAELPSGDRHVHTIFFYRIFKFFYGFSSFFPVSFSGFPVRIFYGFWFWFCGGSFVKISCTNSLCFLNIVDTSRCKTGSHATLCYQKGVDV